MTITNPNVVVGVFDEPKHAQDAIRALKLAGFREEQIGVVTRDQKIVQENVDEHGSMAAEGAITGVAAGAGVGALWAMGIAAGMLPVIGPVIAGGLLMSVLASAAGGAAIAGVLGGLIGLGIPEEEARYYETQFQSGRTLVTVMAYERYTEALAILNSFGAHDQELAMAESSTHA